MKIRKIEVKQEFLHKRVAAYARVSTFREEQELSFETQCSYYSHLIHANPDWEFVKVFSDQGFSGVNAEKRPGFMEMIAQAERKAFDILLVKSISRFARNAAEAQVYVHKLKSLGIEVRFERENLSSFDASTEMVFNMLAACAQEESRSISERTKWGLRKKAKMGIRHLGNNRVLGYEEVDGVLVPNENAWVVKLIFQDYAAGKYLREIIEHLNDVGATPLRSNKPFASTTILNILKNEIYVGDRRIQKQAPLNYLTKMPDKTVAYDSVYVKNAHEGIISRELWNSVQMRFQREAEARKNGVYYRAGQHFLYGLVFCADCGKPFKCRTIMGVKHWKCADRLSEGKNSRCRSVGITEEKLMWQICDALGWEWTDVASFDKKRFLRCVEKVIVGSDGTVELELSEAVA